MLSRNNLSARCGTDEKLATKGWGSFTNFRCVKISVASDHGAFGVV